MKTYIVYDRAGRPLAYIKAGSHNSAEKKAVSRFGEGVYIDALISGYIWLADNHSRNHIKR